MKEVLDDYRCVCGKLLFRGLIISGGIEVKCRFCKNIQTIGGLDNIISSDKSYLLILDKRGTVVKTGSSTTGIVGYAKEELFGMNIRDLIVMLAPNFYSELWDEMSQKGHMAVLFQSLHHHKDKSLTPVQVEVRSLLTSSEQYIVFIVEKKKLSKATFAVGGTLQTV